MPRNFRSLRLWIVVFVVLTLTLITAGSMADPPSAGTLVWPVAGPV
jgi:hypothetical protein